MRFVIWNFIFNFPCNTKKCHWSFVEFVLKYFFPYNYTTPVCRTIFCYDCKSRGNGICLCSCVSIKQEYNAIIFVIFLPLALKNNWVSMALALIWPHYVLKKIPIQVLYQTSVGKLKWFLNTLKWIPWFLHVGIN